MRLLVVAALLAGAAWWLVPAPAPLARVATARGGARLTPRDEVGHALLGRWRHLQERRRAPQLRTQAVVELAQALACELRAGQPPPAALAAAVLAVSTEVVPSPVVAAARSGGPVADLLEAAAVQPGAAGLSGVAACWRVADQSGAGLARGLEQLVVGLRDEQRVAREVAGQLAAPRATGRLLALLPVVGLLLGSGLGAAPLEVLLTSPIGWACLAVGLPLQLAGWWWVEQLARSVEPWRR